MYIGFHRVFTIQLVAMEYGLSKIEPSHSDFNPWTKH